jgi:hypothetical protein
MKKSLLMLVVTVFISSFMMSCSKKCGHCNVNGSAGPKYCNSDNGAVYDAAVASCVTGGGNWEKE